MKFLEVVDIAKKKTGSDNATAKALGIDRRVISNWRQRGIQPSFENGVMLCNLADINPALVVLDQQPADSPARHWLLCQIDAVLPKALIAFTERLFSRRHCIDRRAL